MHSPFEGSVLLFLVGKVPSKGGLYRACKLAHFYFYRLKGAFVATHRIFHNIFYEIPNRN